MLPWCLLSWALTFRRLASQPTKSLLYRVSKNLGSAFLFRGWLPPMGFLSSPRFLPKQETKSDTLSNALSAERGDIMISMRMLFNRFFWFCFER